MARDWYGHGQWQAPYWFIGPEPGMAREEGDDLSRRCQAWLKLGGDDLVDCIGYHQALQITKWHDGSSPPLQPTWRQLIRLLLTFQGKEPSGEDIRNYQRTDWGTAGGETCVLELSSLAANNMGVVRNRETFLNERAAFLCEKIRQCKPTFVVMYGTDSRSHWEEVAGGSFDSDGVCEIGQTVALIAPHPVSTGSRNQDWVNFGKLVRTRHERRTS